MSSLARVLMTGLEVTDLLLALGKASGVGDRLLKLAQQREPRLRTAGVVPVNVGGITSARDRALAGPSGMHVERASALPRSADVAGVDVSPPPPALAFVPDAAASLSGPSPVTAADATGEPLPARPELVSSAELMAAAGFPGEELPGRATVYRTTEATPLDAGPTTPHETPSARRRPPTG